MILPARKTSIYSMSQLAIFDETYDSPLGYGWLSPHYIHYIHYINMISSCHLVRNQSSSDDTEGRCTPKARGPNSQRARFACNRSGASHLYSAHGGRWEDTLHDLYRQKKQRKIMTTWQYLVYDLTNNTHTRSENTHVVDPIPSWGLFLSVRKDVISYGKNTHTYIYI